MREQKGRLKGARGCVEGASGIGCGINRDGVKKQKRWVEGAREMR